MRRVTRKRREKTKGAVTLHDHSIVIRLGCELIEYPPLTPRPGRRGFRRACLFSLLLATEFNGASARFA